MLVTELDNRRDILERIIRVADSQLKKLPRAEGRLRISNARSNPQYYKVTEIGDTRGKYIKYSEMNMVRVMAQKDYLERVKERAEKELKALNQYRIKYSKYNIEEFYVKMHDARKEVIKPLAVDDDTYAAVWQEKEFIANTYKEEEKVYSTKRGEMVRSKSEVMIADMYHELGVPYRYEAPLKLKNGKIKYPDFTVLKKRSREVIYHEHLGLIDNGEYVRANAEKIYEYMKNGIYLGKNLIITYESTTCPLDMRHVRSMMEQIFCVK